MAHGFYSSGWKRAPEIAAGSLVDMGGVGAADPTIGWTNVIQTIGMRGIRIQVLGDTDDDDIIMVIFGIDTDHDTHPKFYSAREFGTATWDCGLVIHPADLGKLSDPNRVVERYADEVAWVGTAQGNAHFSYANSSVITAQGVDDSIAELLIPDLGNLWGIVLAFEEGAGTGATAGALFKLDI